MTNQFVETMHYTVEICMDYEGTDIVGCSPSMFTLLEIINNMIKNHESIHDYVRFKGWNDAGKLLWVSELPSRNYQTGLCDDDHFVLISDADMIFNIKEVDG